MLVRSSLSLSVALLLIVASSPVQAEQNLPSQSMLSAMGLSGITVMSDADAMAIRGLGYSGGGHSSAIAYGSSYASIYGYGAKAHSEDGFEANGKYQASGNHESYAGIIVKYTPKRRHGHGGHGGHGGNPYGGGGNSWGGGGGGHPKPQPKPHVHKIVAFAGGSAYSSVD